MFIIYNQRVMFNLNSFLCRRRVHVLKTFLYKIIVQTNITELLKFVS